MRSAVLTAPGRVELADVSAPAPGPGQVRVRLEGCGVCHSNLPVFEGRDWFDYPRPPGSPGHEGWGVVDAVGDGVGGFAAGDRVGFLSGNSFAEYDLADAAAAVPIPAGLSAFPAEPLGCAVNVFRRSGVTAGSRVVVVGIGFLGAVLVRLAADLGADVTAVGRRPCSLRIAGEQGAADAVTLGDAWDTVGAVRSVVGDEGADVVIECTGHQQPLDVAAELVRVRGRLVIAGYHQDGPRSVNLQSWNWRGIDVINAHERDPAVYAAGMRRAAELCVDGTLDVAPLLTHRFPFAQIADAFAALRDRPGGFLKAWVDFGGGPSGGTSAPPASGGLRGQS